MPRKRSPAQVEREVAEMLAGRPYLIRIPNATARAIERNASKLEARPTRARAAAPARGTGKFTGEMHTANYYRVIERGEPDNMCIRCGKVVKDAESLMVEWDAAPGWFPVGSDCAKHLRKLGVRVLPLSET